MADDVIQRSLGGLGGLLLFAMMVLTVVDVVGRYAFNAPLPGAIEAIEIFLGMMVFAALPRVTGQDKHITIDLIDTVMPKRLLRVQQAVIGLINGAVLGGMAYVVWQYTRKTAADRIQTDVLEIPMAPVGYFISAMCFAASVFSVRGVVLSLIKR